MIDCTAHFTTFAPSGAGKNSFAPSGQGRAESRSITQPCRGSHGQSAVASGDGWQAGAGTAIGKEPIFGDGWQAGAGTAMGKEPIFGDGWQEQGQPWAESQFCGDGWQAGTGQQGHFCVSRKGTDNSKAIGAFLRKQKGDGR